MDYFIYKSFAYNYKASTFFLKNAESSEEGSYYNILSSILFSALTLEAYVNHQGSIDINNWKDWDKKKKPTIKQKLEKFSEFNNFKIDYNANPYSVIDILFEIRNIVSHGQTITIKKKVRKAQNNSKAALKDLETMLEKQCTIEKAKKFNKKTKKIIESLNEHSKNEIKKSLLWNLGGGSYQIKIPKPL